MQDTLTNLIENGYRLVPLMSGQNAKRPRDKGYAEKDYSREELSGNVGLLIDTDHVDIDLDWPEAQFFAWLFPFTRCRFARGTPPRIRHLIYRCAVGASKDYKLPKVQGFELAGEHAYMVLQMRTSVNGGPCHVMIPPSVHPSGEALDWAVKRLEDEAEGFLPTAVSPDELVEQAGIVAAMSMFLRFYPGEGQRDEFALTLAGALVRGGWPDEQIEQFIMVLSRAAGDEEYEMRANKAPRVRERLNAGKPVRGLPKLAEVLNVPMEWIKEVAHWLGLRTGDANGAAIVDTGIISDVAQRAWHALEDYQIDGNPAAYGFGDAIARVNFDRIELLDRQRLRHELNRAAQWVRETPTGKIMRSNAPMAVVDDMLAARKTTQRLAPLKSLVRTPIFSRAGELVSERGYHWESQTFVAPSVQIERPLSVTAADVRKAIELLKLPLTDFPFDDISDQANTIAMSIEPYVRDHFECSPLYYVNKPAAGTGASLLVYAATFPALGHPPPTTKPPTREEEMEKFLMATLMEGAPMVFLDNATYLGSTALAAALTADRYKGRILGVSRTVEVPVRTLWVATGNNPDTTGEMYRRCVDIRLDAEVEFPEDRPANSFAIPDLKRWTRENRSQLVTAALTLVQNWVDQGMPSGSKSKASFETWSTVMSGILESNGIEGFLETPESRRPVDQRTEELKAVIAQWLMLIIGAQKDGQVAIAGRPQVDWTGSVKASDIWNMISEHDLYFETMGKDPARAVGDKLRSAKDRTFELETKGASKIKVTLRGRPQQNSMRWWLQYERLEAVEVPAKPPLPF